MAGGKGKVKDPSQVKTHATENPLEDPLGQTPIPYTLMFLMSQEMNGSVSAIFIL